MMSIHGKTILVTGGSRGIGKAMCIAFAQEGANIILNYATDHDKAQKALEELKQYSKKVKIFQADVSSPTQVAEMFKFIDKNFDSIDVLINNAGWTRYIPHQKLNLLSSDLFTQILDVHLKGTFLCSVEAIKRMEKNKTESVIINIASTAAFSGMGSNIAYCAAKAGVVNMTKSMARAFGPKIRVNCIAPGLTETEMTASGPKEYLKENIKHTPLKRIATPIDVSNMALNLVDNMNFVTGQTIVVDGGKSLNG
jgi:3-oxoacyl-[acyl-carrier protein] reductase